MKLTTETAYALLEKHGVYVTEACDKCGQLLGAMRYTRKSEAGEWCSKECRDGKAEALSVRKGGRPRKYRTPEELRAAKTIQQREYRQVAVWKKPSSTSLETNDLQAQKSALSHYPLDPPFVTENPA